MTDFERHSLKLLSIIASGIDVQINALNCGEEMLKTVSDWRDTLQNELASVDDLIEAEDKAKRAAQDASIAVIDVKYGKERTK